MQSPTSIAAWLELEKLARGDINIGELLQDKARVASLQFEFEELFFDFSKQAVSSKTFRHLIELAKSTKLQDQIAMLFSGKPINFTENKPALHTLCRDIENKIKFECDERVKQQVQIQLNKIEEIVTKLHNNSWRSYSGKKITTVIHIGVGGSELGALTAITALEEYRFSSELSIQFVSNLDGLKLQSLLNTLNPETTLFVVVSKSFLTLDTLTNAETAKRWFLDFAKDTNHLRHHFIGISSNAEKMTDWGIAPSNQIKLWDWVGGRFSLWSAVGFTIALFAGMENFKQLLLGANQMDIHFKTEPLASNIPVVMGMIGIWNYNFLKKIGQLILPYDNRLINLPNYLRQLLMESNGKSANKADELVGYETCPIVWGDNGTNAQHSFYQLLHQGTRKVCCDFIIALSGIPSTNESQTSRLRYHQNLTIANCIAQSQLLALGKTNEQLHKTYLGDQPSTSILINKITPRSLGMLLALYEHIAFVQASVWQINPFDQWGVEHGKGLAKEIYKIINSDNWQAELKSKDYDASTKQLIAKVMQSKLTKEAETREKK